VRQYTPYALNAVQDGVGGWIVFGEGVNSNWSGRFSSPQQTVLLSRVSRAYDPFPIPKLGKEGSSVGLTGLVKLEAGNDIEITRECIPIFGVTAPLGNDCDPLDTTLVEAICIGLKDTGGVGT
jgi:hypothetical protein